MKKRILSMLVVLTMLLGMFPMMLPVSAETATELAADVYVATTGVDTNAGTVEAPVQSLNQALELVADGGTVHIVDSYTAPAGFTWATHGKDVTITGGKLDLSAGYAEVTDGTTILKCYTQGDAVTYDNLELVLVDGAFYFANGLRMQVNENVTVTCKDINLFGGGYKKTVKSTNVTLLGGDFSQTTDGSYSILYGGSYKAGVNGNINFYLGNINPESAASHDGMTRLYAGCYNGSVTGDINLTYAGANMGYCYGGNRGKGTISGDVNVLISGGNAYSFYGGGNLFSKAGTVGGTTNLTMTGGTIAQLFGANIAYGYEGNVVVHLKGGTITRRFFGGCYNEYGIFTGYETDNHVSGNIDVFLYEGMNLAWNTSEDDAGFYAHSRYKSLFDDEVTTLYYVDEAAKTKHESNLGSQNSGMNTTMGSDTAVADTVSVVSSNAKTWNMVLGDMIGVNFYMEYPEAVAKEAILNVTVAGNTVSYDLSERKLHEESLYWIPVQLAAAQMTEEITLQLVVDGTACEAVSYSAREYAETILTGDYDEKAKTLVKHMLNYGAAAQQYFNYKTDDLADVDYELTYTAQFPGGYDSVEKSGEISGVSFYGASLTYKGRIAVRYYFDTDSVEGVTFTANGKEYTAVEKDGLYYVEIGGINPQTYSNRIKLTAAKGEETLEVTYSPMCYMVRMSINGRDTLKALLNAMYGYHEAAIAYVGTVANIGEISFPTLEAAVAAANEAEEAVTIELIQNVSIGATLVVENDITIVNASGKEVTISRNTEFADDMFQVNQGAALTLGISNADETGELIVDGVSFVNGEDKGPEARIVTVASGATFTLNKHATLQNSRAKVNGGAIYTESANTYIYGTLQNNVGSAGGAIYVAKDPNAAEDAAVVISGASFLNNRANGSGGALQVAADAKVNCENALFEGNKGYNGSSYVNGGAVYTAGSFTDTNSNYIDNEAKNGGAIIVMSGGELTMTATDAVMQGNYADVNNGGAVFVNGGGKATITGYTLQDNTSGSIQVQNSASATIDTLIFVGDGNTIAVNGSLTLQNLTNAQINQTKDGAAITLIGSAGTNVSVKPYSYTDGAVILTNTVADLIASITLVQPEDGTSWSINQSGKLAAPVTGPAAATITVDGATVEFATLQAAIDYANVNGGAEVMEIVLLDNAAIDATLEIQKNIAIVNNPSATVTISRDADMTGDMFVVIEGAALTLGSENAGALVVDGATTDAIAARIVTVASGATFTLNQNATLCNANSTLTGGALQTAGTTNLYGTISGNYAAENGGAVEAIAGIVTINGATFSGNEGGNTGAALFIKADATVTCQNATFTNNIVPSTKNGGAIYVAGTFTDNGSIYTGNQARNGGAIFLSADTAVVTLTGDADAAFTNNKALTANGGAIYVNGGTLTVNGYTFEGNTASSNADSAIHVAKGSATVENAVFQGDAAQSIYVATALTAQNLTNVQLVQATSGAAITLSGNAGTNVSVKSHSYTSGHVVLTNTSAELIATITLVQPEDGTSWSMDETGALITMVASVTVGEETTYYTTLEAAVAAANTAEEAATIVVLQSVSMNEIFTIEKDITIVNLSGKEITISRGAELAGDMFVVSEGASLTLGSEDAGALLVDGATTDAIAARTVTVASGATFTLNKNATLQGANSTLDGGAIQTSGTTYLYGTISNNYTADDGAGVDVSAGTVIIDGAIFSGNESGNTGAALCIRSGATVTCQNATFENNTVPGTKNGGAIYVTGTFTDSGSIYTGNQARNGGAIFLSADTAVVTLTGDADAAFTNNKALTANGGAIYVNGGTLTVNGYTFEGNTASSNADSAIHVAKGSATVEDAVFQGDAAQSIYVATALTAQNLTNVQLVQATSGAAITFSGNAGTNVSVKPNKYVDGHVVLTDTDAACIATITLVQPDDGSVWVMDENGALVKQIVYVATITANGEVLQYETLEAAIAYANENGDAEVTEIVLLDNVTLTETLEIQKNIAIVNASNEEITISRGADLAGDMFSVSEGAALTLGSEDEGALIIDGATTDAIAYRTVTVASGATFTLNKNATLCNANSTLSGAALHTTGVTYLYGTISYNKSTNTGAGVFVANGADVTCVGATFQGNDSTAKTQNGGAVYIAGKYTDNGSRYIGNKGKNGAAIFNGQTTADVVIENATFEGNQATANGAAIFVNNGTLTVRNSTFTDNTKTDGSTVNTIHRARGTLYIGVNVLVDGTAQEVTEPTTEE